MLVYFNWIRVSNRNLNRFGLGLSSCLTGLVPLQLLEAGSTEGHWSVFFFFLRRSFMVHVQSPLPRYARKPPKKIQLRVAFLLPEMQPTIAKAGVPTWFTSTKHLKKKEKLHRRYLPCFRIEVAILKLESFTMLRSLFINQCVYLHSVKLMYEKFNNVPLSSSSHEIEPWQVN